jgi:hypothetical protein
VPNKHHGDLDYGAIIDGGLGQKSVEASNPIHGDQCEAQHREYTTHHYSVYASDLIAEVVDLEAALTLGLHLMRASLCKALDHLCSGREVVNGQGYSKLRTHGTDEIGGHMDLYASDPSEEGITDPLVDVGIELSHQLCYGR